MGAELLLPRLRLFKCECNCCLNTVASRGLEYLDGKFIAKYEASDKRKQIQRQRWERPWYWRLGISNTTASLGGWIISVLMWVLWYLHVRLELRVRKVVANQAQKPTRLVLMLMPLLVPSWRQKKEEEEVIHHMLWLVFYFGDLLSDSQTKKVRGSRQFYWKGPIYDIMEVWEREYLVQKSINRIRPNLKDGGRNKKLSKHANTRKDEYRVQNQGYSQKVIKIIEEKFRE